MDHDFYNCVSYPLRDRGAVLVVHRLNCLNWLCHIVLRNEK